MTTTSPDAIVPAGVTIRGDHSSDIVADSRSAHRRLFLHPLTFICAAQAALSLVLVWSNTAFGDEANYLWAGRVVIAHWLHGFLLPPFLAHLSGSPEIYPPLGAMVSNVAGLAGARILSLGFMLLATALLYDTARRIAGRAAALFAAALWALSEPVIRLAFATYDPMSVALTAIAAWLVYQSSFRGRRHWWLASGALCLALANATAFSGVVIDPVVFAFGFFTWFSVYGARKAIYGTLLLITEFTALVVAVLTVSDSWAGTATILSRTSPDIQSLILVLGDSWKYSGLIAVLAVLGVVAAGISRRREAPLLIFLGLSVFVVPIAQLKYHTAWSLDKHLAYGLWFGCIAAGYGVSKFVRGFASARSLPATACCVLALTYPAVTGMRAAWSVYHAWPNASSFITAFEPIAARSDGRLYTAAQVHIAEYYSPRVMNWARWDESHLPLGPVNVPPRNWKSLYESRLRTGDFGAIALFYVTSFSANALPRQVLFGHGDRRIGRELLSVVGANSGQPGLAVLTQVLEHDSSYRLVAVGPYNSSAAPGIYAIWKRIRR